jgi:hypothetical protein
MRIPAPDNDLKNPGRTPIARGSAGKKEVIMRSEENTSNHPIPTAI